MKQAESDLEAAATGISDQTPLRQAGETYTSAAFALEMSWITLFADAGCLTDEQSKQAADALRDTTALQKRLKESHYNGKVDGIYSRDGQGRGGPPDGRRPSSDGPRRSSDVDRTRPRRRQEEPEGVAAGCDRGDLRADDARARRLLAGPTDGRMDARAHGRAQEVPEDSGVEPTGDVRRGDARRDRGDAERSRSATDLAVHLVVGDPVAPEARRTCALGGAWAGRSLADRRMVWAKRAAGPRPAERTGRFPWE